MPFLSKDRPGLGRRSGRAVRVNAPGPIAAGTGLMGDRGNAAVGELETTVQHPMMKGHDGGDDGGEYTGHHLAEELFDLMRRRLPRLADDDPYRHLLMRTLPVLGEALGRPQLVPVGTPARQQAS